MRILLVSDAWEPQVNGVVRTLQKTAETLRASRHEVDVLSPQNRTTLPCPSYPEIRLTLRPNQGVRECMRTQAFEAIHIATEGPLGMAMRRYCVRNGLNFTSSYHTRFPEYLRMRAPIPLSLSYRFLRWFHGAAARTFVRTETQRALLKERGFDNLEIWPGGVDTELFKPYEKDALELPRPIAAYMGRVSLEKNIEAFLDLELPGSKVVIGGGPALEKLKVRYPDVHFLGYRHGEALARTLASSDVFVFPSKTDTLGLVILEAMACGVPVAAFPVPGPNDLIIDNGNGALDEDLREAVFRALAVCSENCVDYAAGFSWQACTDHFVQRLVPAHGKTTTAAAYNSDACPSSLPVPKHASTNPAN